MRRPVVTAAAGLAAALVMTSPAAQLQVPTGPTAAQLVAWHRVLAAEDARLGTPESGDAIRDAILSNDRIVGPLAVRALGRIGDLDRCQALPPLLSSRDERLRIAAISAAAPCYVNRPNMTLFGLLAQRASAPADAHERAAAATAIGRLTYEGVTDLRAAEQALVDLVAAALPRPEETLPVPQPDKPAPDVVVALGALTGLESLERRHTSLAPPAPAVVDMATRLVRHGTPSATDVPTREEWDRARRLALQILVAGRAVAPSLADIALRDPDAQVRRLAAISIAREEPVREDAWTRASADASALVRYAALSELARRSDAHVRVRCERLLDFATDHDAHVALLAIDLAARCQGSDRVIEMLENEVGRGPTPPERGDIGRPRWHRQAHALVSLAALAPERASAPLERLAADRSWQVRMYAARAAGMAGRLKVLRQLGRDEHDNVREAAIAALRRAAGHDADDVYLDALARTDYQVVMTAARALEGTPRRADARAALLSALDRITLQRRETSRDARRALLGGLAECGDASNADRVEPYLSDFDPAIASHAASLLATWTGRPHVARPKPPPRLPLPTPEELARLLRTHVILHMRALGDIELRLLARKAPLNAFRFARLAAEGYYDGLTFHRVVPGFVIQGGSPGANEYMGDGPFTRDEVGAPNRRGTVGLSTRGRDTGDAQLYVNLVDNYRLDEDYTVFAEVVRGLTIVDDILEGDVIGRASVVIR